MTAPTLDAGDDALGREKPKRAADAITPARISQPNTKEPRGRIFYDAALEAKPLRRAHEIAAPARMAGKAEFMGELSRVCRNSIISSDDRERR